MLLCRWWQGGVNHGDDGSGGVVTCYINSTISFYNHHNENREYGFETNRTKGNGINR